MPGPRPNENGGPPPEPATAEPACPICGDLGWYKLDLPPGDPRFGQLQPCECRSEERLAKLAGLSGLKDHEQDIRLGDLVNYDSVTNELIRLARGFVNAPRGWLYLWGGPGNGKSLALQAIVNELTRGGVPAIYTTFSDLLDLMRETFGDGAGESYQARFQRLQSVRVLAIDELDKVNDTKFVWEFRSKLMDHRYRDGIGGATATLFASNKAPEEHLPGWLLSRVEDGRFQVFHDEGGDVRQKAEWGDV